MRSTGSKSVRATDVFVPEHRALSMYLARGGAEFPGARVNANPLYRVPLAALGSQGSHGPQHPALALARYEPRHATDDRVRGGAGTGSERGIDAGTDHDRWTFGEAADPACGVSGCGKHDVGATQRVLHQTPHQRYGGGENDLGAVAHDPVGNPGRGTQSRTEMGQRMRGTEQDRVGGELRDVTGDPAPGAPGRPEEPTVASHHAGRFGGRRVPRCEHAHLGIERRNEARQVLLDPPGAGRIVVGGE